MPTEPIVTFIWGGAALLALAVGTTAPRHRSVMLATLLLYLTALFTTVWITGAIERGFGSRWLMSAQSWGEHIRRYGAILICSSIGWTVARWLR